MAQIYEILWGASFATSGQPIRRYSIGSFDTPMIYSWKYDGKPSSQRLRAIAEPGSLSTPISQQIDDSLVAVNQILDVLGWQGAAEDLNRLFPLIFPPDPAEVDSWRGGIWLGMDSGTQDTTLKIYMNLRHQSPECRWGRLAQVFSGFADKAAMDCLWEIAAFTSAYGNPAGLCVGIDGRGIRGIRFYVTSGVRTEETAWEVCTRFFPQQTEKLMTFLSLFAETFGAFGEQSASLGFDFAMGETGRLIPVPQRFKVELSCYAFTAPQQRRIPELMERLLIRQGFSKEPFLEDKALLLSDFGNVFYQYLSMGVSQGGNHLSLYVEPYGAAPAAREATALPHCGTASKATAACLRAEEFLLDFRRKNGCWSDFNMDGEGAPGRSDLWVEAYVAAALPHTGAALQAKRAAAQRLQTLQNPDCGWGYCTGYASDADSSAQVLLLFQSLDLPISESAYGVLLGYQREDGGFSTYQSGALGNWAKSHPDVSMSVVRALSPRYPISSESMRRAWQYIAGQLEKGEWPAYWWLSPHYTALEAVKCCREMNWAFPIQVEAVKRTRPTGGCAFDMALYLELLHQMGGEDADLLQALLGQQRGDGSFSPAPILRVPDRGCARPWEDTRRTTEVQVDQNALFATASAVRMLKWYAK